MNQQINDGNAKREISYFYGKLLFISFIYFNLHFLYATNYFLFSKFRIYPKYFTYWPTVFSCWNYDEKISVLRNEWFLCHFYDSLTVRKLLFAIFFTLLSSFVVVSVRFVEYFYIFWRLLSRFSVCSLLRKAVKCWTNKGNLRHLVMMS